MRLRKNPKVNEKIKQFEDFVTTKEQSPFIAEEKIGKWKQSFENQTSELYVELGTGKGDFISQLAESTPDKNFIGIEMQQDVIYVAAKKIRALNLKNVRLIVYDINLIENLFAEHEIDRLYINFCDPWPKKRHAKRRLTHELFLEKYRRLLVPNGEIHFKTDNPGLFEFSLEQFKNLGLAVSELSFDLHADIELGKFTGNIETEYERKFSGLGEKIFRCVVKFP